MQLSSLSLYHNNSMLSWRQIKRRLILCNNKFWLSWSEKIIYGPLFFIIWRRLSFFHCTVSNILKIYMWLSSKTGQINITFSNKLLSTMLRSISIDINNDSSNIIVQEIFLWPELSWKFVEQWEKNIFVKIGNIVLWHSVVLYKERITLVGNVIFKVQESIIIILLELSQNKKF